MPLYNENGALVVTSGFGDRITDLDGDTYVIAAEEYIDFFADGSRYQRIDANGVQPTEYIAHYDDLDTYIQFTDDRLRVVVGAVDILDITEAGADTVVWNEGGVDIDFRWEGVGAPNALFIQGSDGKIGIGTAVIPHGGVGYAMLALEGANGSANGPHIQFTTATDDYPTLQILNWGHDNIGLRWDAYFDGVERSSDAGSNFLIHKRTDLLKIQYDSGIAQGAAIIWNNGIVLDTSGRVMIQTTTPKGSFTVDAADNQTSFCMNWETMADDASIALETYITSNSGILFVIASENLAAGSFFIQGGGNAVTIINDSKTNLSITDVDGKVCVIPDGDSTYTLKNRLGGAYQIRFMFFGN